jgi:hypothetical protein
MIEATSKRAAAISVSFEKLSVTLPLPRREREDTFWQPFTVDNAPSKREVASISTTRVAVPGHEKLTLILCSTFDGEYWILSLGKSAMPMTDNAAIISNTEKAGMPLLDLCSFGVIIGGVYKSRNRPKE